MVMPPFLTILTIENADYNLHSDMERI